MELSHRVRALKPSATVAVMNRAAALKREGVDVLNFSAGEPDFDTPAVASAAAVQAIQARQTRYTPAAGDAETRGLIARLMVDRNRLAGVTPEHVAITSGVKMGLYLVMQSLFDPPAPGAAPQEMLLPVPAWVSFAPIAELAGARVVELPTTVSGGFKITPEQLRAAITPRSRVLLINSPSNPCSTMYTPSELRALAAVVEEAARTVAPELVIVSDELYQHIVFGSVPFASIGAEPGVAERTITINGPGKSYAMTGWRLGWVSGCGAFGKQVVDAVTKLQGQTTTCVPAFSAAAMRAALTGADADLETMRRAFAQRAELIFGLLSALPGVTLARPIGAFYAFPDVSSHFGKATPGGRTLRSAADVAAALLDEHRVAVVPGEDFGGCGHRHIRMSFACGEGQIRSGVERLGAFLASLR